MSINLTNRIASRQNAYNVEETRLTAADVLRDAADRQITMLDPSSIKPYSGTKGKGQPYHIQEAKVLAIASSIKDIGFLQPVIVRTLNDGSYEMLSGHHRLLAANSLAAEGNNIKIPAIIYTQDEVSNELAYQIVAESNTATDEPLPSERSEIYARYMKLNKLKNKSEKEKVAELLIRFQVSKKSFYRYLGLQKLIPQLRKAVDDRKINIAVYDKITAAYGADEQLAIASYLDENEEKKLSKKDIDKLYFWKDNNEEEQLTLELIYEILKEEALSEEESEEEKAESGIDIYDKIYAAFPGTELAAMSHDELDEFILRRLASYVAEIVVA